MLVRSISVTARFTKSSGQERRSYSSFLSSLRSTFASKTPQPPRPREIENIQAYHGKQRSDPFAWMENIDDPHLPSYIQAENEYCKGYMRQHRFLQKVILKEMKQKLRTNSVLPPLKTVSHGYEYYSSTSPYGMVYLRKPLGQGRHAPEEVLLDSGFLRAMNVTIRKVLLSPDHTIFAYNTEREGMEYGDLHFKDLHNRQDWEGEILQDVFNFVWANDQTVFYTMANEQLRPCKVYAHRIGTEQSEDVLVYDEHDETAFVDITSTKDSKFVTINSNSLSSSEIRVVDASYIPNTASITPSLTLIEPRQPGLEYYVDHHHDAFYILTNAHGATNFKLMKAQNHAIGMPHWQDIITLEPTDKIDDVDLFQDHIIVYGRRDGLPMVLCYNITDQSTHQIPLPSSCCVVAPGSNLDFTTHQVRFSITSPLSHEATYEYDMVERQLKCIRSQAIQSFDKQNYTCSQIHVESHDGQRIPVTLIHPKNLSRTGRNPILMRSYGAYGNNTDPDFRIEHFPLLERGWTIALAHVRGGGELGRQWYEDGKLDKKLNSFKDFISVAKFLGQDSQWSSPEKIAALGTSAGGLLVGGMAHLAPQLFKALVLRVPFVDPLSAMLNPSLPLTSVEVPEWGDPLQDAPAYDWIMQYSPYDNVAQVARGSRLPAMYVTAGMKDQRVLYWQPLKFVARLRHHHQDLLTSPVLLNIDLDHGHFGGHSEQDVRLSEAASQVTFLISQLQQTL